jgi:Flp pilus assembly protein TadD
MKTRSLKLTVIVLGKFLLCYVLLCATGCRLADFHGGSGAAGDSSSASDAARLSDRQLGDVQLSLARSLEQQGETARALDAYREVAEKNPRKSIAYWRMAVLHDRKGDVKESESLYRQALKADPKNPDIHCDFGYSLYLQRRWGEAEDHLRRVLTLKPSHRRAHNNLGLLLAQNERTEEALAEFGKSGCEQAEAHANLAFILTLNRRWDDARQQYELALEANPGLLAAKTGLDNLNAVVAKASQNDGPVALAKTEHAPPTQSGLPGRVAISTADRAD